MIAPILRSFAEALSKREAKSSRRRLTVRSPGAIDFSSNDFLSLSTSDLLRENYLRALNSEYSSTPTPPLGSGGSRLLDGNSIYTEELEKFIASFHDAPSGLLFNSGYDANVGVLSCVPQPGDVIIYDELIHASAHEGMRLSRAGMKIPFQHNSLSAFEKALKSVIASDQAILSGKRNVLVVVESLYSMDGDTAPVKELLEVIHRELPQGNGHLIVDEAHATGVFGPKGAGIVQEQGMQNQVFIRIHTFGKALASQGAIVLCSPLTREYLINYARSLIYTTAMSRPTLIAIRCSYELMQEGATETLQSNLQRNIEYLRVRCDEFQRKIQSSALRIDHHPRSPIFSVRTAFPRELAQFCQQRRLLVRPIMAPTVPKGKERVRVCLHAGNTRAEIDQLVDAITEWAAQKQPAMAKL